MCRFAILCIALTMLAVGCGKEDPIVGEWEPEGVGVVLTIEGNGELRTDTPNESRQRCLEAGFEPAVEQCEKGYWEPNEQGDGYLLGFPTLAVGIHEVAVEGGTLTTEVTHCRCQGRQIFAAQLDSDTLTVNMERVGGPVMVMHRR